MLRKISILAGAVAMSAGAMNLESWAVPDCNCKSTIITAASANIPPTIWQGFYIGANLGAAFEDLGDERTLSLFFPSVNPSFQTGNINGTGIMGGIQLGYNWQSSNCCLVAGFEADIGGMGAGLQDTTIVVPASGSSSVTFRGGGSGGFFADITGRLGYNWNGTLLYGKGGVAWFDANAHVSEYYNNGSITTFYGHNSGNTLTGWTAGGGFESMITPRWSWKVEYMHFDFGNIDSGCCFDGRQNFRFFNSDLTIDTIKVGINYFINGPQPYLKW